MGFCHCCLKETDQDFCRACSKALFGVSRFSATLDFDVPQLAFAKAGTVKRISISGAQTKFSVRIENKKLVHTFSSRHYCHTTKTTKMLLPMNT